ncbi:PREDICTED: G2/M phase-specific E3 ubiquitin-protein ligase-like [Branchiostoma belcheri]|uniref:G2/M phase-specific E3 ubiquitin-protein ligase-like n=1 Tax=Branchiostoma belcheri TaxID=7741 RepID=A0A6P4ZJG2_BRABE|nr:PREDICTED: G2/M phase-specific E3 ubiquitin-protein ligase-like [Branchiostoma belcheri]
MVKVKFIGEEDTLDFGGPKNEMFRMALQGIFETSGLFEPSPHGYLPISSPIAIVNGDFEMAGKAMAMSIVHLGPAPSCLHPAIVSALCGEDIPDMSGFHPVDREAAAFVTKLESATEGSLKDILESDEGLNITSMAGWHKTAGSTTLADIPTLRKALCLQDLVISRKAAIEHLKQGLDLLGLRKALEAEPQLLAELLCKSTKKTTATNIIDMMVCKFSAEGSSRKNVQKDVFDKLCSWMDDVESGSTRVTLGEFLQFFTALDAEPPTGWPMEPMVAFAAECPVGCRCLPVANTCSFCLTLPLHMANLSSDEFSNAMEESIISGKCFGRA